MRVAHGSGLGGSEAPKGPALPGVRCTTRTVGRNRAGTGNTGEKANSKRTAASIEDYGPRSKRHPGGIRVGGEGSKTRRSPLASRPSRCKDDKGTKRNPARSYMAVHKHRRENPKDQEKNADTAACQQAPARLRERSCYYPWVKKEWEAGIWQGAEIGVYNPPARLGRGFIVNKG